MMFDEILFVRERLAMFRYMTVLSALVLATAECWAVQPYTPVQPDPFLEPWRWQFFDELNGQGLQCLAEDSTGTPIETAVCMPELPWASVGSKTEPGSASLPANLGKVRVTP